MKAVLLAVQVLCARERERAALAAEPRAAVFVSPEGTIYSHPEDLEDASLEAAELAQATASRQRRAASAGEPALAPTLEVQDPELDPPTAQPMENPMDGFRFKADEVDAHHDAPATFHDLLLFPRGRGGSETFFRGWAELMASDGETTILHEMDQEIAAEPSVPWWPQHLDNTLLSALTAGSAGFLAVLCYYASTLKKHGLERGRRSTKELIGICCFRFYSGLLMCTWLPFLLAEEGAVLMPAHQSMFMGMGKLILAAAMILCPVFGLLNDQTVHVWGRRRAWFIVGIGLLFAGILGCALASEQKCPYWYLVATMLWCFGEAVSESTTEALIPDLVSSDEYLRAASARSVLFMLGGFCGYGAIILQATVLRASQSVFYMYYIVIICVTSPFVVMYSTPTEAERKVIEDHVAREAARVPILDDPALPEQVPGDQEAVSDIEAAERSKSYFQRCYVECFNASPEFRLTSLATFTLAVSTTGMMFILLIVRDVVGLKDAALIEYHMAAGSLVLLSSAVIVSLLIGAIGIESSKQGKILGVFMVLYTLSEFGMACVIFFPTQHGRLVFLYNVAMVKGVAFGGIYNIMQPVTWDAIPEMWRSGTGSISRAMSWIAVCRSVGVGVGNFIAGFILDFAKTHSAVPTQEENYPLCGYIALFLFTGSCSIVTIWLLCKFLAIQEKPRMDRSALPPGTATSAQ